jgi:hypothetical protein
LKVLEQVDFAEVFTLYAAPFLKRVKIALWALSGPVARFMD